MENFLNTARSEAVQIFFFFSESLSLSITPFAFMLAYYRLQGLSLVSVLITSQISQTESNGPINILLVQTVDMRYLRVKISSRKQLWAEGARNVLFYV